MAEHLVKNLKLDSKSRHTGTTSDYRVYAGASADNIYKAELRHVSFTNNFYNIVETPASRKNNAFSVFVGMIPTTLNLSSGFYSLGSIFNIINPFYSGVLTVTYSAVTDLVSVTVGPTVTTLIGDGWENLGFLPGLTIPSATTATATYSPRLAGLTEVYLASRTLAPGFTIEAKDKTSNVFARIPIAVPWGYTVHWEASECAQSDIFYSSDRHFRDVDIQLLDSAGNVVDLRGSDMNVLLAIYTRIV